MPGVRNRPRPWWGEAPEQSKGSSKAVGKASPHHLLGLKSRRAVVYRGPRLGASIGLTHSSLSVMRCALIIRRAIREPRPTKTATHLLTPSS